MPRRGMILRRACRTLERTMAKLQKEESSFRNPPLWIHVSQAGQWLFSRREARKRAVIRLLDRLKTGVRPQPKKTGL